ncbi:MAG: type II toxin-antitoxin system RelB/DinJ family antitoxin [Candidatus Methanomethylophilaceae archaeon]|nr:type II toxin-antitoxin system RelB/DinJ family antitoxin [Candidatus Methanomethylophilaceae archaeon]
MTTTAFSIRMDENLKNNFERMCESFGISMTAAFNLFATAVVNERRIPFEIKAKTITKEEALFNIETMRTQALSKIPNGLTLDEINEEIDKARNQSGQ